jgi:glycosyltransferase involved in cell wall biosynthesis
VAVTRTSLAEIRKRYPEQPDQKFFLLFNGYDPEMFAGFRPRQGAGGGRIVVTHVGTAYKTASPRFYLDALDGLPEAVRSRVETRFIGRISEAEEAVLQGRKSPVRVVGFQPQSEALRQMEDTDYLLLTMTNDISLPGKLFEYLATGKRILALSPKGGEVDRILQETGAGWCVDPGDAAGIQAMIRMALDGPARFVRNEAMIRAFERPVLAAEYGRAIRGLIEDGKTAGGLTSVR